MANNFQTGKNKIKLLTEYESVTQKVLSPVEPILQNAQQLQKVACKMSKWYSISLQMFSSIYGVTFSIAATTLPVS
jgi:hypothetical protein